MVRLLLLLLAFVACEESVPDGRIRFKNDSQDSEFNVVDVSAGGAVVSLKPGESILLPPRTSSISVSRQYRDYVRRYQVSCPYNLKKGITMKLIDVHLNRIAGGCTTTFASH